MISHEPLEFRVERWDATEPRWDELIRVCEELDQGANLEGLMADYHLGLHTVVALTDHEILGLHRFWTQTIGVDEDKPPFLVDGKAIIEAKGAAFAVRPEYRRQGIGRRLQEAAIVWARELGCYQMRSRSLYSFEGNHALKLSMGFGIQPAVQSESAPSAYFLLPLRDR